jgi:aspartate/methionine/tyrosine aminotransferase
LKYERMIMEAEAPDSLGTDYFRYNLAESSVRDRSLGELGIDFGDMVLPYGHHFGLPELRTLIAEMSAETLSAEDILVTAGAAGALFIISTSLLQPGDHMVVGFPNYATNFETPNAIGARVEYHAQTFDQRFRIDVDAIEDQVTSETRLLSLTCPHNPSGVMFSRRDLERLVGIAERKNCWLVLDETYRDMAYGETLPVAASLSDKVISVSSMSKTWGVPGIRIGWLITRNTQLMHRFISAKEQIGITGSVLDETVALQTLRQRDQLLPKIHREIEAGFQVVKNWVDAEPAVEWVQPDGGVTCCLRVPTASDDQMRYFYDILKTKYRTAIGPGYWFKLPLNQMRIGFGWSSPEDTAKGLECISLALGESLTG